MKVILRDPPLVLLLTAIVLNLPVERSPIRLPAEEQGWLHRQLGRFLEWRDSLAPRA